MSPSKKNSMAVQANSLISARYRLTLGEQFLVLVMISKIDYKDSDFQGYEISIKELANTLQLNEDCTYREANTITDKLLKRILRIPRADGSLLKCNWIASAEHFPGRIVLTPSPALRPYLLELRKRFTKIPLEQMKGLRRQHTVRIYMLLRQYVGIGSFELTVDEFRAILSLEKQYQRFSEMRRWVLDPAQKELRLKSDLSFKLETTKTGRTIFSLKFIIVKNKIKERKKSEGKVVEPFTALHTTTKQRKFPEYWDEFLKYLEQNDPGLLPIIASDGPECGIVKVPYLTWRKEVYNN